MIGFVYSGIVCVGAVLCAMAIPNVVAQPPVAPDGAKAAVWPRQPGGLLRDQLGKYLTIEGVRTDFGKVETGTLLVNTVDGKKLDKPVEVLIHNLHHLPGQQRCLLKGNDPGRNGEDTVRPNSSLPEPLSRRDVHAPIGTGYAHE